MAEHSIKYENIEFIEIYKEIGCFIVSSDNKPNCTS